jgi:hypothetical protein
MTNVDNVISSTGDGLANNRSEMLAALAEQGELGRARLAAARNAATKQQEAMVQRSESLNKRVGGSAAAQADLEAMMAARRGYIGDIQDNQAASYERGRTSMTDRNTAYLDQIGAASVLQQQELDAMVAAQKQLLDAQAAQRVAAAAGSSGGGGSGGGAGDDLFAGLGGFGEPTEPPTGSSDSPARGLWYTDISPAAAAANVPMDWMQTALSNYGREWDSAIDEAMAKASTDAGLIQRDLNAIFDRSGIPNDSFWGPLLRTVGLQMFFGKGDAAGLNPATNQGASIQRGILARDRAAAQAAREQQMAEYGRLRGAGGGSL